MSARWPANSDKQCPNHSDIHTGLQTRVLDYLFKKAAENQQSTLIKCSYIEIYNESIKDLLNPTTGSLQIRENVQKGVFIEKVTEEVVKTSFDVLALLSKGMRNRHVGSTNMNDESSRSHTVLTVSFESQRITSGVQKLVSSKLHFVDLAGSERQKKTNTQGDQLKEAAKINQSLSTLGEVINTLASSKTKKVHVKYRNSKLTYLLRDSLGGNSKTTIIANISPAADNYSETLSTLQFAQRAKTIQNKASINEETAGDFENLKAENCQLKDKVLELHLLLRDVQDRMSSAQNQKSIQAQPSADECELLMQLNQTVLDADKMSLGLEEQLRELQQRLNYEYLKRDEFKTLFDRACETGSSQEHSLKLMVRLFQERESRLKSQTWDYDSEVKFLREQVKTLEGSLKCQPVIMQVFQENLQLKQQIIYANVDGKPNSNMLRVMNLLRHNLTYLEDLSSKLEKSIEEREKLAKRFEKLRLMQGGTSDQFRQVFTEEENEELRKRLEAVSLELINRSQLEEELLKKIEKQQSQLSEEQQEHEKTRLELKSEIKSLEDRILELNNSYAVIQHEGQETNSRFAVREVELRDKITGLELKKSELLKKLDRNEQRTAEERKLFEERFTTLNKKTQQLNLDMMRLAEELTVKKQSFLKLKDENGLLKSENQSLQSRLAKQNEEALKQLAVHQEKESEYQNKRTELEKVVFSLQNQIEASGKEAEEYKMESESLAQRNEILQQELDNLNESYLYMKELAEARASEVMSLQEEMSHLKRQESAERMNIQQTKEVELVDLHQRLRQSTFETEDLSRRLKLATDSNQTLLNELLEVKASESNFRSAFFEAKEDVDRHQQRIAELMDAMKHREQENDELKSQLHQISAEREEEKKEYEATQGQLAIVSDEKKSLDLMIKNLEVQQKDQTSKQKKLEDELRLSNDKVAKLQMNLITVQQQSEANLESLQLQMRSINEQNKILISEKNEKEAELDMLSDSLNQKIAELTNQLKETRIKCSSLQSSGVESVEELSNQGVLLAHSYQQELQEKSEQIEKLKIEVRIKKQLLSEQQRKYSEFKKKGDEELHQIKTHFRRLMTECEHIREQFRMMVDQELKLKSILSSQQDELKLMEQKMLSKEFDLNRLSSYAERVSERNEVLEIENEGLRRAKTKILKYIKEHENMKEGISSHDLNIIGIQIDSETRSIVESKKKEQKLMKSRSDSGTAYLSSLANGLTLYSDEKELLQQIMVVLDDMKLLDGAKSGSRSGDYDDFEIQLDMGNSSAKKKRKDDNSMVKILNRFYQQVLAFRGSKQDVQFKLKSYDNLALKVAKLENEIDRLTQRQPLGGMSNLKDVEMSSLTINKKPQYIGKENQAKEKRSAVKSKAQAGQESANALRKRDRSYVGIFDSSEASANEEDEVVCIGGTTIAVPKKTHSRRLQAHENQKRAAMMNVNSHSEFFDSNAPTPKKF